MKALLKVEFERAFRSRGLLLSLMVGFILAVVQFIVVVIPRSKNILEYFHGNASTYPYSVFNSWFGMDDTHPYLIIYMTIFPILATLPYAVSYFEDRKKGYIKGLCTRAKRNHYLMAKYAATFVSGGIVVVLPMVFNLILTASVVPSLIPVGNGLFKLCGVAMFADIFYTHPYMYILIYLLMYFVYGGVFASLALACSYIFDYSFFVIIFPFAIYYGIGIISPYARTVATQLINPRFLLTMSQPGIIMEVTFFGEIIIIGILAYAVYMWKGVRNDIF